MINIQKQKRKEKNIKNISQLFLSKKYQIANINIICLIYVVEILEEFQVIIPLTKAAGFN